MQRIDAKVGDPVQKGQTVAVLEPVWSQALDPRRRAEAEAGVSAARAGLKAAREKERAAAADADYLDKRLERITNLHANGYVAKDQFDQAMSEVKKAQAVRQSAEAAVDVARFEMDRALVALQSFASRKSTESHHTVYIPSPITGAIFRLYRESEGTVSVGEPLMDVGNAENLEVRVEVLSSDAVKNQKGNTGSVQALGRRYTAFRSRAHCRAGRIYQDIQPWRGGTAGSGDCRYLVPAGHVGAFWVTDTDWKRTLWFLRQTMCFRSPTVRFSVRAKDWAVFIHDNGKARKRLVEVGLRNGFTAEILSGIHENDKVIAHPDEAIHEGSRIRPRK